MKTRIMMVDDHLMLCEALRSALVAEPDLDVVAVANTAEQALSMLEQAAPDLLLLDIGLPDMTGMDLARQVLAILPSIKIVALSGYTERMFVDEMLKVGVRAYVVKSAGTHELIMSIRAVLAGHVFLSPEITAAMIDHLSDKRLLKQPTQNGLGQREIEVLSLVVRGMRSAEIAQKLHIQPGTVDVHRANIKKKLGVSSIAELTHFAIRHGLATQ